MDPGATLGERLWRVTMWGHSPFDDGLGGATRLVHTGPADNAFNQPYHKRGDHNLRISLRSLCGLIPRASEQTPGKRAPRDTSNTEVLNRKKGERVPRIGTAPN